MIKNYLLSAYRNLVKTKFYSALNILGLGLGFTAIIFIMLYLRNETGYDRHHDQHQRVYRIQSEFAINENIDRFAVTALPLGPAFELEFPEVEKMVRFANMNDILIRHEGKEFYEKDFYYADSTLFEIFTHEFIYGNPETALNEIGSAVLTESIAKKYFGDENPVGRVLETGAGFSLKVTGVIKDLPVSSHLRFNAVVSLLTAFRNNPELINSLDPNMFWNVNVMTYVMLYEGMDVSAIYERFPILYDKYMKTIGDQIHATFVPKLTPIADLHLQSGYQADLPTGNKSYIYIFATVGLFILLLASINYMNMATARSVRRAREVGIRKVSGAHRSQLVFQFITESLLTVFLALIIALVLAQILLPEFNTLIDKQLKIDFFNQPEFLVQLLVLAVVVGLISGSYPAFYLSSFEPVKVIKGTVMSAGRKSGVLRKFLVVFQFWIAIVMIIGTIVVSEQLRFIRSKDLGFNKHNLVFVQMQDTSFRNKHESFKHALLESPYISGASNTMGMIGVNMSKIVMRVETEDGWAEKVLMNILTDFDYPEVMEMKVVEGRSFDRNMATDYEEAVLINQTAARQLGWTDSPIGKRIHFNFNPEGEGGRMLRVIGVLNDFHATTLHNAVEPFMIAINQNPGFYMAIRIDASNQREALGHIEDQWYAFGAGRPFDYRLLNETLDLMYENEEKTARVFTMAAVLTIFIALLGLLGLSSFVAEQRNKEIGIRKVLGASESNLATLLYRSFLWLILAAFVLAAPFAWWQLNNWLESNFVYHIDIGLYSFIWAGVLALVAGIAAVSYHLIKVVTNNPVEAIQYE